MWPTWSDCFESRADEERAMMERAPQISGCGRTVQPTLSRLRPPPISREHGAWVMLYTPILIVLLAAPAPRLLPCLLLLIAATCAFCLQHVVGIIIRRRGTR